jgi:hypothetical protein
MPEVGGRTPTTNTAPRTPSTDSGVCAISPSDLVGYTGNALNRIKDLEQRVAELEAANVEANQLSDLSQQIGWVGDITYMGVPGWTQTSYGTLIPPAGVSLSSLGFTMSDGNQYPFVVMDEDGVLQFGFDTSGNVSGASVSGKNYVSFNTLTGTPGADIDFGNVSTTAGSGWYTFNGSDTVTLLQTGVYAYNLIIDGTSNIVGATQKFVMDQPFGYPFTFTPSPWTGVVDSANDFFTHGTNFGIVTTAPCTVQINWQLVDASDSIDGAFQIIKVGSL